VVRMEYINDVCRRMVYSLLLEEIRRRGGETTIEDRDHTNNLVFTDADLDGDVTHYILRAEGWRYYSRRVKPRLAQLSYFCGFEGKHPFAVRVAGNITTVKDAIEWLEPAEVKKKRASGKKVIRQGDVYFVESTKDNFNDLPGNHNLDYSYEDTHHKITHPTHATVYLPKVDGDNNKIVKVPKNIYWKAIRQRAYRMGRTSRRGNAD